MEATDTLPRPGSRPSPQLSGQPLPDTPADNTDLLPAPQNHVRPGRYLIMQAQGSQKLPSKYVR